MQPTRRATPTRPTRPAGRAAGGGLLGLPPWTRAPFLPFRQPAVVFAVVAAAAILACASASPALFLSSASSAALQRIVAAECADATDVALRFSAETRTRDATAARVAAAMTAERLGGPSETLVSTGAVPAVGRSASLPVRVLTRPGVLDQVTRVSGRPGTPGVWVPSALATTLALRPGDPVRVGAARTSVAGVYRNLFEEPVRPSWCSYRALFVNTGSGIPPPPLVLATDPAAYVRAVGDAPTDYAYTARVEGVGSTLAAGRSGAERQLAAYERSGISPPQDFASRNSGPGQLPAFVERATLIRDGLRGPVLPIGLGGTLLALLLVAAAGSYWAERRRAEVRLLSARGVGPVPLAAKAVLELATPAVLGSVLGWLLARWLVGRVGPSPDLDAAGPIQAAITAAGALLLGLLLLGAVAGLRSHHATERPIGARRSRLGAIPWELALIAAGFGCYLALRSGRAVVIEQNVAQINLLVVVFPLLFVIGAAVLAVRLLALLLPVLGRRAGRLPPALYLAARRVTASRAVSIVLLAAASTPVAMTVYASTLTQTAQYTLESKARIFAGSDASVLTLSPLDRTARTDAVGTVVIRYLYARSGETDVTVLAIDPDTFAGTAFWDGRFADESLPDLLARLRGPAPDGRVPALLVERGPVPDRFDVSLGRTTARLAVVAEPRLLPGRRLPQPLLLVDRARLGAVDPHAGTTNELWTRGEPAAAEAAIAAGGGRLYDVVDRDSVFRAADFLGIAWTFDYLRALAALVGLVAVGGLLLYLETRQRSRVASYALGRRMGLGRGTHLRSLLVELGVLLGVAYLVGAALAWAGVLLVYRLVDVDPSRPPPPLLSTPVPALLAGAGAVAVVTVLAAAYAQRAADRADVAEVLRLGG